MVSQRQSTISTDVAQLELLPTRKAPPPVDKGYVLGLPALRRAVRYSVSLPDLDPKQVYEPLGMDKAIWSRIENGGMSFPADRLSALAQLTGNCAPLIWLAHEQGFDLRPQRSELQERLDAAEARATAAENELEVVKRFFRETQGRR